MLSVWCVDQLQPYVYCVYCPVLAMYLMCPCPQTRMMRQLLLCGLVMGVFSAPQHTIVKKSGNIPAVSLSIITTSPLYYILGAVFRSRGQVVPPTPCGTWSRCTCAR